MLDHLPALIAGLVVAIAAVLIKNRRQSTKPTLKAINRSIDSLLSEKIKAAQDKHDAQTEDTKTMIIKIENLTIEELAKSVDEEFSND